MNKIQPGDICENGDCGHSASGIWIGNGGTLAMTRSYMQSKWCECCMLKVQVAHAEERAKELDALRMALARACADRSPAGEDEATDEPA